MFVKVKIKEVNIVQFFAIMLGNFITNSTWFLTALPLA